MLRKFRDFGDPVVFPVAAIGVVGWLIFAVGHLSWKSALRERTPTVAAQIQSERFAWASALWLGSVMVLCIAHARASRRRRQIERELRRRAQVFRNIHDAIFVTDLEHRILDWNPGAERTFGYTKDEMLGQQPYTLATPQVVERMKAMAGAAIVQRRPMLAEVPILRKDGSEGYCETVIAALEDDQSKATALVAIGRDVTERYGAQQSLNAAMNRLKELESMVNRSPAVVFLWRLTEGWPVEFVSENVRQFGYTAEDFLSGRVSWPGITHPDDVPRLEAELIQYREQGIHEFFQQYRLINKEGEFRWIEDRTIALADSQGRITHYQGIILDVTDLKTAQQRALQAERLAAIGQMVTGLAHESGNALQRSQACLEMLSLEVRDRPAAMNLVDRIQSAQDHLRQLYDEVRQYAAPIVVRCEPLGLTGVVEEAWSDLEPARKTRQTRLELSCEPFCESCAADRYAVKRVFRNILENALAACGDPVQVTVRLEKAQIDKRPAVRIRFRDNGPGLSPDQRKRIFDPFFTTKTQGTGLGMAISKRIVEAHGGEIAADDADGCGAELIVTLPKE